jgi:hypothetical protein
MIEECTCSQMVKSRMAAIFVSGALELVLESKTQQIKVKKLASNSRVFFVSNT